MAARQEAPFPELVDLLTLSVSDFDPLLAEEIVSWHTRFNWDFRPSADLLRRFLHMRSLQGFALRMGRSIVGYAYYVIEERKGLIGDFYLSQPFTDFPTEMMLLGSTVQHLMMKPGLRRIECQLLMFNPAASASLPFRQFLHRHDRFFMSIDRATIQSLAPATLKMRVGFASWTDRFKEEAAHLVAAAYRGHVDSEINDQYRTIPGARHFLLNIIQYPGCGRFSPRPPSSPLMNPRAAFVACVYPAWSQRGRDTSLSFVSCRAYAANGSAMNCSACPCSIWWRRDARMSVSPSPALTWKPFAFMSRWVFASSPPSLPWSGKASNHSANLQIRCLS